MVEDDRDRASETEAERAAEIESELERVGENPEQVDDGSETLGSQSAPSGEVREDERDGADPDDAAINQEAQELPDDQQAEQWADSGGDEELAEEATGSGDGAAEPCDGASEPTEE